MESLLRQLAGDHPPGPMPGTTDTSSTSGKNSDLSPDEEEKAFQRAIEMMLSTEGMAAMGLDDKNPLPPSTSKKAQSSNKPSTSKPKETTSKSDVSAFEETIRKAMESLNSAGGPASSGGGGGGGGPSDPAELAKLLASLGNDPNLDLEGDDDLSGILDGMMGQLMTREVLEEPLSELASKVNPLHAFLNFSRANKAVPRVPSFPTGKLTPYRVGEVSYTIRPCTEDCRYFQKTRIFRR